MYFDLKARPGGSCAAFPTGAEFLSNALEKARNAPNAKASPSVKSPIDANMVVSALPLIDATPHLRNSPQKTVKVFGILARKQ